MRELILIFIISGITFISFIIFLIFGFVKKNRKLKVTSIILLMISIIFGIFGILNIAKKTYNQISDFTKPRNGNEIYESLFGKSETNCVKILNFQDQKIPKIDYAIWLHFKTCPKELKRILNRKQFKMEKISAKNTDFDQPFENQKWFKPEKLEDSIFVFKYFDERNNVQEIYILKNDSTEVYIRDIAD